MNNNNRVTLPSIFNNDDNELRSDIICTNQNENQIQNQNQNQNNENQDDQPTYSITFNNLNNFQQNSFCFYSFIYYDDNKNIYYSIFNDGIYYQLYNIYNNFYVIYGEEYIQVRDISKLTQEQYLQIFQTSPTQIQFDPKLNYIPGNQINQINQLENNEINQNNEILNQYLQNYIEENQNNEIGEIQNNQINEINENQQEQQLINEQNFKDNYIENYKYKNILVNNNDLINDMNNFINEDNDINIIRYNELNSLNDKNKSLIDIMKQYKPKDNNNFKEIKYNDNLNYIHKTFNNEKDYENYQTTGRIFPSVYNKFSYLNIGKENYIQVINIDNIKDLNIKNLMLYFNISWYLRIKDHYKFSNEINAKYLFENKNLLLFRLLYTTIKDKPSMNVNITSKTKLSDIHGFTSYVKKIIANNNICFMFLSNPPILITIKSNSQRNSQEQITSVGTLTYIKDNKIYRRYGNISISNNYIIGFANKNNKNKENNNIEYKYINKIIFEDSINIIEIEVIPYIINNKREDCYEYEILINFKNKNNEIEKILITREFFIYEECIREFLKNILPINFKDYKRLGIPAALNSEGLKVPPILGIDNIIIENTKSLDDKTLIKEIYKEDYED